MPLSPDEVRHVAALARLDLDAEALRHIGEDLDRIVAFVEQLSGVDTEGVEPIANVTGLEHVTRADEPGPMLDRDELLRCAPLASDRTYLVPKAVER